MQGERIVDLQRQTQRFVNGTFGGHDGIQGFQKNRALVPFHVVRAFNHVITNPAGNGHEFDLLGVITAFSQEFR